eukprot:CAMPEP_0174870824 /NCGR_PEP_ID=MMETSP1114-20130205/70415_1 /TAXON_ID=312471 /ORGANISM="Neobodo designis, Strain CCAP 1951/1" /LENGTH=122 /DNA_ID=CAMNT_0016106095 /DNA_START=12 /DNA_END=380 /DNA_ORIENTATION=-
MAGTAVCSVSAVPWNLAAAQHAAACAVTGVVAWRHAGWWASARRIASAATAHTAPMYSSAPATASSGALASGEQPGIPCVNVAASRVADSFTSATARARRRSELTGTVSPIPLDIFVDDQHQ